MAIIRAFIVSPAPVLELSVRVCMYVPGPHFGLRSTRMTLSPRRKSFVMNRSLYTGFAFFCPFPVRGTWAAGDTHRGRR